MIDDGYIIQNSQNSFKLIIAILECLPSSTIPGK